MTATVGRRPRQALGYRNAALLMTATSFLVPMGGVLTAPVLARALGVDGRGLVAAAVAPSLLMVGAITLGLPEAVLYLTARQPSLTRRALAVSLSITTVLGVATLGIIWAALPFLSGGNASLGRLMLIATSISIPTMWVTVLRGAAAGRQMWRTVALERVILTVVRLGVIVGLWLADSLDVFGAVLISSIAPAMVAVLYVRLFRPPPQDDDQLEDTGVVRPLLSYGSSMWLGSLAISVLGRMAALLMVPLSSETELGLYVVAVTISDVPWIVATQIQGTLFGSVSKNNDVGRVTLTSRTTLLLGFLGCAVLGALVPLGIGPLFGDEFTAATVPTLLLLAGAVIAIPGFMAASGLSAWGRPAVRSIGYVAALVVNLVLFVVTVPPLGVYGACITNILGNVVLSTYMVIAASRVLQVPILDFLLPHRSDVAGVLQTIRDRRAQRGEDAAR